MSSWRVEWRDARRLDRVWRVELVHDREQELDRVVRRTLIETATGEVVDDVWLDDDGRVRSWSRPRPLAAPASPGPATELALPSSSGAVDRDAGPARAGEAFEHGAGPRALAHERRRVRQGRALPGHERIGYWARYRPASDAL